MIRSCNNVYINKYYHLQIFTLAYAPLNVFRYECKYARRMFEYISYDKKSVLIYIFSPDSIIILPRCIRIRHEQVINKLAQNDRMHKLKLEWY